MSSSLRIACCSLIAIVLCAFSSTGHAANTAPTISGAPPPAVYTGFNYWFRPNAYDANGNTLRFWIKNKPAWASFDTSTGRLNGKPSTTGLYSNIVIGVSDGYVGRSLPAFSIRVRWNHAPTISGTPKSSIAIGSWYAFQPKASDRDGQKLKFRIRQKPAWANFSTSTGKLSGTPPTGSAGTYLKIRIIASDGVKEAWLPAFSIKVYSATNRAPTISGAPVKTASVGHPYAFKPTAADADGDRLTFRISNKPGWANFDTSNGTLYDTPTSSNIGVFGNIIIGVSDGKTSASLAPFSITVGTAATQSVSLQWTAPTRNTDGSALTDLAGYKVYYGNISRQYSKTVTLQGAGATSVVIDGLASGTWYFSLKSFNTTGVTSAYGGEVKVVL